MALGNSWPGPTGVTDSVEARKALSALLLRDSSGNARAGVAPRHFNALATARADMKVDVAAFEAALVRGGGPLWINNDGTAQVTLAAAPGANSRYDVVYAKQNENGYSGFADGDNLAGFGVQQGAAGPTPSLATVLAAIPTGALPIAAILIPSTATATNSAGVVITQVFPYTALSGAMGWVRLTSELTVLTAYPKGTQLTSLEDGIAYVWNGTTWQGATATNGGRVIRTGTVGNFGAAAWTILNSPSVWTPDQPALGFSAFNGVWTVPAGGAGVYDVEAQIQMDTVVNAWLVIKRNSVSADGTGAVAGQTGVGIGGTTIVSTRARVRLNAGDTIAAAIYVSAAAAWSNSNLPGSFIGIRYVEPLR